MGEKDLMGRSSTLLKGTIISNYKTTYLIQDFQQKHLSNKEI